MHRHAAARFRLRTAYLVLHFSDEALAGYRQPVADQGALIDLRGKRNWPTSLPSRNTFSGRITSFTRCPAASPRGGAGTRVRRPK